jgi:hypothetical protein
MVINILFILIVFVFVTVAISYYADLITKKEEYSRDDLKNILPFAAMLWEHYLQKYSLPVFIAIFISSSFASIVLTLVSASVLLNSSLLFIIVYFALPVISGNLEKSRVTDTGNYFDHAANIIIKHSDIIILGWGAGSGAALIYSWGSLKQIGFIWFVINLVVVIVLSQIKIRQSIPQ